MKNLISILFCIVSFTVFAEAANSVKFENTPLTLKKGNNYVTVSYSSNQNSMLIFQIFDSNWNQINQYTKNVSKTGTNAHYTTRQNLKFDYIPNGKFYIQVKLRDRNWNKIGAKDQQVTINGNETGINKIKVDQLFSDVRVDYIINQSGKIQLQMFDENWKQFAQKTVNVSKGNGRVGFANIDFLVGLGNWFYLQIKLTNSSNRNLVPIYQTKNIFRGNKDGAPNNATNSGSNIQLETFPNPVKDIVNLEYNLLKEGEVNVELYNPMGKLIKVIQNNKNQAAGRHTNTIDASTLNAGMYIIKVATKEGVETSKILKQ